MNILDAIAMPMFDCFVSTPDKSEYNALPNRIALDEMNPDLSTLHGKTLYYAKKSMEPQFIRVDRGDDQLLNRIIWFSLKGNESFPREFSGEANEDEESD